MISKFSITKVRHCSFNCPAHVFRYLNWNHSSCSRLRIILWLIADIFLWLHRLNCKAFVANCSESVLNIVSNLIWHNCHFIQYICISRLIAMIMSVVDVLELFGRDVWEKWLKMQEHTLNFFIANIVMWGFVSSFFLLNETT